MKFGEKLIVARLIDRAQLDAGLSHQVETDQRIGEALLELGYISEDTLLRALAKEFNTRYVSTAKLSRLAVQPELLELVPQKMAEQHLLFPILLDSDKKALGVVTPEPQNREAIEELRIVTGMNSIAIYLATREAVSALVKKHYRGDLQAFSTMDKAGRPDSSPPRESPGEERTPSEPVLAVEARARPRASGPVIDVGDTDHAPRDVTSSWTRAIEAVRDSSLVSDNDFIETLNILVGLLEVQRDQMQGHSARVARQVKTIGERLGLAERDINHAIIASYLHDLGKRASAHLTLPAIAASDDYRARARRYHLTPARLFDSVHLPPQVNRTIAHLYENFDGTGLPEQFSGDAIPIGARLIAVVDAFEDFTQNPSNPTGEKLSVEDALAEIQKGAGRLFDPKVVTALSETVQAEQAAAGVSSSSPLILVADADASSTAVLELKLMKRGFRVRVARDSTAALDCLEADSVAALLVDMRLEPQDGFTLMEVMRERWLQLPVFVTSTETSTELVQRAFELGAADFFPKPFVADVVVAKLFKELVGRPTAPSQPPSPVEIAIEEEHGAEDDGGVVIEFDGSELEDSRHSAAQAEPPGPTEVDEGTMPGPPRGTMAGVVTTQSSILSGSIEGKSVLALIRALSGRRKSGLLSLRKGERKGFLYFEEGHIFQAMVDDIQAEEAFLELAAWRDCLYKFDPEKRAKTRAVRTGTGKLLQIAVMAEGSDDTEDAEPDDPL